MAAIDTVVWMRELAKKTMVPLYFPSSNDPQATNESRLCEMASAVPKLSEAIIGYRSALEVIALMRDLPEAESCEPLKKAIALAEEAYRKY